MGERGGAIGWGMGATMGVKLANPDKNVIGIIGDGSAMMTVKLCGQQQIVTFL